MQNKVKCKNVQHINHSTWCPECLEPKPIELDYSKISDVEVGKIHMWDAPDFTDAFIEYASYDGRPMTDEELDILNQDHDYIYAMIEKRIY